MTRSLDREKAEILSGKDLKELRYSLAHLSVTAVRDFYEQAYQDCRLVYNRLPSPRKMQTLLEAVAEMALSRSSTRSLRAMFSLLIGTLGALVADQQVLAEIESGEYSLITSSLNTNHSCWVLSQFGDFSIL